MTQFGLIFESKETQADTIKLVENESLSINNKSKNNLLIEGENLTALKFLCVNGYKGKIDVIYIDPPYNTNIDKLSYKDCFDNKNFTYSHSEWLNFMRERLVFAKNLLSKSGVMFVSLDKKEISHFHLLSIELFKEKNIDILIWPKLNPLFDKNRIEKKFHNIKYEHEYIVVIFANKTKKYLHNIVVPYYINKKWINKTEPIKSILNNLGTTSSAKDELFDIFGIKNKFLTPKPIKLIKELIRSASNKDSTILDFFAGSGTTGHATMDLNYDDNGTRNFILINNNENNICREVTYQRLKHVIKTKHYKEGLKYFQQQKSK